MKRIKFISFVCLAAFVVIAPVASADSDLASQQSEEAQQNMEKLKDTGKKVLKNVGEALNDAGNVIEKKAKSFTSKACLGTWLFKNGKASTTIICNEDGSMEIRQKSGFTTNSWKGSYSSTANLITFRVMFTETKSLVGKSSDSVDETWTINYKVTDDSELKLVSDNLPDDSNGYDFSNPAVFIKQ